MQIGVIGLGEMGGNIVRRLMKAGHDCVVYDSNPKAAQDLAKEGAKAVGSLEEMAKALSKPRAVWSMLPSGKITEDTVEALGELSREGRHHHRRRQLLLQGRHPPRRKRSKKGIHYVDCGTSGGVWGVDRGYCMMIGGDQDAVDRLDPIFKTLAPGIGDIPRTRAARASDTARRRATSTPARPAPATSSRWCTTASSTA